MRKNVEYYQKEFEKFNDFIQEFDKHKVNISV